MQPAGLGWTFADDALFYRTGSNTQEMVTIIQKTGENVIGLSEFSGEPWES